MMLKQLPEGWKEVELGNIFNFEKKSKIKAGDNQDEGKYKFFTSSDIQSKFIDKAIFDGEYLIFSTGGSAGIHYCNEKFSTSTDCFVVKIDNILNAKYVYYYLFTNIHILEAGFKGAGLKHISKEYLKKIKIIYPENKEIQKEIVFVLENVEKAKEMRADSDELTKDFLKSVFYDMFGDPGNNEKNWNKQILENNCIRICVSYVGPCDRYYTSPERGVPMIRTGNLKENYLDLTDLKYVTKDFHEKNIKSQLHFGDLLVARHGTNGQAALVPETLKIANCLNVVIIRTDKEKYDPIFLQWLFNSQSTLHQISGKIGGSTQSVINTHALQKLNLIIPPLPFQNKFSSIVREVEQLKGQQKKSKEQIDNLFNVLMQKAFRGELV